jgi:hypothetical protein
VTKPENHIPEDRNLYSASLGAFVVPTGLQHCKLVSFNVAALICLILHACLRCETLAARGHRVWQ